MSCCLLAQSYAKNPVALPLLVVKLMVNSHGHGVATGSWVSMNLSTLLSGLTNCASSTGNRGKKKQSNNNNNRRTQDGRKFMLAVAIAWFRVLEELERKASGGTN
jgi:hypothetical protein